MYKASYAPVKAPQENIALDRGHILAWVSWYSAIWALERTKDGVPIKVNYVRIPFL